MKTNSIGRRKTASARVRLLKGKGESVINGKNIEHYFVNKVDRLLISKVFDLVGLTDKYYFSAKVAGGGKSGQIAAIVHGIARAIVKIDKEKYKSLLKKAGYLKRDPRERQRRMVGTGGKSRRKKQSPKR